MRVVLSYPLKNLKIPFDQFHWLRTEVLYQDHDGRGPVIYIRNLEY